jgi:hypothetical protein
MNEDERTPAQLQDQRQPAEAPAQPVESETVTPEPAGSEAGLMDSPPAQPVEPAGVEPGAAAAGAVSHEAVSDEAVSHEAVSHEAVSDKAVAAGGTASEAAQGQSRDLPEASIAAVGERLGQRVAQASEAVGDKVAHVGEAAAQRVAQVGETAGQRLAQAGEAAGQRVILVGENAEHTVIDAQARIWQAARRVAGHAEELFGKARRSVLPPVREKGSQVAQSVRQHPRETAAGSAFVGLVAVVRRRRKRQSNKS